MAKYIQVKPATEREILEAFKSFLRNAKSNTGVIDFKYNLNSPKVKVKPLITFTTTAYMKINTLVQSTSTEIGWHGTVKKIEPNNYIVTDIVVYPQVVTGATVDAPEEEYAKWLTAMPDEIFNELRLQGHSHVNFTVTPSGTDNNFYNNILQNLEKTDFYIFMIVNKRGDLNIWLYDFSQNMIFEKEDLQIDILLDGTTKDVWYKEEAESKISKPKATRASKKNTPSTWTSVDDDYCYDYIKGCYIRRDY